MSIVAVIKWYGMSNVLLQATGHGVGNGISNKNEIIKKMQLIHILFESIHPDGKRILKVTENNDGKKFRFALAFPCESAEADGENIRHFGKLESAAEQTWQEYQQKKVHEITKLLNLRERI